MVLGMLSVGVTRMKGEQMIALSLYLIGLAIYCVIWFYFVRWTICAGLELAEKRKQQRWTDHRGNK